MKFKRHESVEAMLAHRLPDNQKIVQGMQDRFSENIVSQYLFIARTKAGVSQAEMAERLGVTQGAISKMENRGDTLKVGDMLKYLAALDFYVDLGIVERGGIQDRLGYHADRITAVLEALSNMAGDDPDINTGTLEAFKGVLAAIAKNFLPQFAKKLDKLPHSSMKLPVQINIGIVSKDPAHTAKKNPPRAQNAHASRKRVLVEK